MGSGLKGSQTTKSSQDREPPTWAKPLLTTAAQSALDLFNSGQGYNVYRGPTVADMSPQKIEALNKILQMTGGGTPVSNAAMTGPQNAQVAQVQQLIAQQQQAQQAYKAQQAAAAAAAAAKAAVVPRQLPQQQNSYGTSVTRGMGSNR